MLDFLWEKNEQLKIVVVGFLVSYHEEMVKKKIQN